MNDRKRFEPNRLSRTARTALAGFGTAGLSWLVLLAAIHAGLLVPRQESLSPLVRLRPLDYSLGKTGTFASLREEFIDDVLGSSSSGSASAPTPEAIAAEIDRAPPDPAPPPAIGRPPRTIVEHPFDNDDFGKAYRVKTIPFTGTTETSSATREAEEPPPCELGGLGGGTVWYRYTPPTDLGLIANTFGTAFPLTLAVFRGEALGKLRQLDCDYDEGGNAQVVFPGTKGQQHYFQVTSSTRGGHLQFSLDPLGKTELVSVSSNGTGSSNANAGHASVSAHGRYVAFSTRGDNLVEDDTNPCWWGGCSDVFVRDMLTGRTERVNVSSTEEPASGRAGESVFPAISGNGRFVAFASGAPNLVPHDDNGATDVFVRDRKTGRTERVSVSSDQGEGHLSDAWYGVCRTHDALLADRVDNPETGRTWGESCWFTNHSINHGVSISSDGRYVVFSSQLHGLVPGVPECTDTGSLDLWPLGVPHPYLHPVVAPGVDAGWLSCRQIYVHDRETHSTSLVSISSRGEPANADSSSPFIARGGRWVVFASDASNLAPVVAEDGTTRPDRNGKRDAFAHDLRTGRTELVSLSSNEEQGIGESGGHGVRGHVTISDDGRWVAFISNAPNLADDDLNTEMDVFLRDRGRGRTELITPEAGASAHASISADGRYVALTYPREPGKDPISTGAPLASGHLVDLLVYDRITRTVTRVSATTSGHEANGDSVEPEISADGHFVVFFGRSTNLDDQGRDRDPVEDFDVYIHELPWTR